MVFAGFVAQSFMERTDQLQAELRQTQETLALSLLEQSSAPKRLAGLATVSKIDQPSSRLRESVVRTFDSDSNLNVRLAAVTALRALPREEALAVLLERMESEGSPIVQIEILRQVLNLVGDGSDSVLVERIGKMNMEPRVRTFWEENNQSI
jgi:HEAT repeat protein